jgi:hypothetical protein
MGGEPPKPPGPGQPVSLRSTPGTGALARSSAAICRRHQVTCPHSRRRLAGAYRVSSTVRGRQRSGRFLHRTVSPDGGRGHPQHGRWRTIWDTCRSPDPSFGALLGSHRVAHRADGEHENDEYESAKTGKMVPAGNTLTGPHRTDSRSSCPPSDVGACPLHSSCVAMNRETNSDEITKS